MRTVRDLDAAGKRVLVRADLNVPLDGSRITDDERIRACLPTLKALLARGASVVVCSHLGRPGPRNRRTRWSRWPPGWPGCWAAR